MYITFGCIESGFLSEEWGGGKREAEGAFTSKGLQ